MNRICGDWAGQVAITGIGLVCPVGLTGQAAVAALRAGICRFSELEGFIIQVDEGEYAPVTGAVVPKITCRCLGVKRLTSMLQHALAEAESDAQPRAGARVEVFLGTAGERPAGRITTFNGPLQQAVIETLGSRVQLQRIWTFQDGRAAALRAMRMALGRLSAGHLDIAVAGGVDSWVLPRSLHWLKETGRLREYPRKTGILPGEAAGFLVLERMEDARSRQAKIYARLRSAAGRHEEKSYAEPLIAHALSESLREVWKGVTIPHVLVISDLNGERYRALEWGNAMVRAFRNYQTLQHWHPAEYIGDTGAASGAVSAAWAAVALQKKYARTPAVVVWGASDEGAREALLIDTED